MDTIKEFWYINIAKRTERKQRVEARSKAVGLTLQRYEAVTPWSDGRVNFLKEGRGKAQVLGAIGCALSHYDLWCRSADTKQRIFIQEDDLIYRKDFVELIDKAIKEFDQKYGSDGWDVLHLNPYFDKGVPKEKHNTYIPLTEMTWSLGAYVINPHAADMCCKHYRFPKLGETVDEHPNGPAVQIPDILISALFISRPGRSFTTYPYPSIQDKLGTDVQTEKSGLESDHDFYYNQYGGLFQKLYDWTATDEDFDKPINELVE